MDPKIIGAFGLLCICSISSSIATTMMGDGETTDPVVPKKPAPAKKTPEQIKADEAKAALDALKADPDATEKEIADAQAEADDAQAEAGADNAQAAPPPKPYTIEVGIDYPGSDIFHYSPDGAIKATKDVCLDKCTDLPACKLVTFNNAETQCWGKYAAENKRDHNDRNNYFKDGSF